jgi:molybdopterin/thiamine biosynthesis adenylyltransferase
MDSNQGIRLGTLTGYKALLLDPLVSEDLQTIEIIRNEVSGVVIFDQIESQLRDLIKLQYPKKPLTDAEYSAHISAKMGATPRFNYGTWVYYPWRKSLVHLLPREEFIRVRTIRNAYKITHEEQAQLATKKIGIIGLSVGQSASLAVAIERAAGELRIADFDTLELSNLNRIRSSVCNLGLPKTHMVAREIAELDPYLPVKVFDEGITEDTIESFLTEGGALDLLIEECDSVDIKVLAREHARKHRIPVLMDTSDRGMIDVERYDLDPTYPMLHGLLDPAVDYAFLKTLKTSEEKLPYIAPILGIDTMSIRLRASALEVGQSISTWPQLGGDVMHGGALCVYHAKEILLGRSKESFRRFADELEEITKENNTRHPRFSDTMIWQAVKSHATKITWDNLNYLSLNNHIRGQLIDAGTRASSPGNSQAFKWVVYNDTLFLVNDRSFEKAFSDNFGFGSIIGYGCVLENIELQAKSLGLNIHINLNNFFDPKTINVVFTLRVTKGDLPTDQVANLAKQIPRRETTRTTKIEKDWSTSDKETLQKLASEHSCHIIQGNDQFDLIKELTLAADVLRMTNPAGFHDLFREELIWSREKYENLREGIFIDDLNLNTKERVGIQIYNNEKVNAFLNTFGGGSGFGDLSKKYLSQDAPLCLFTTNSYAVSDLINVGRNIEKFWLELTQRNWSLHPFTSSVMIASYLSSDANKYFKKGKSQFQSIWKDVHSKLGLQSDLIFIAKINEHSGNTISNSLRKYSNQNTLLDAP